VKKILIGFFPVLILLVLFLAGCHKSPVEVTGTNPLKFTELSTTPDFDFENFADVNVSISLTKSLAAGINVVQIYQDRPENGRLIATGVIRNGQAYNTEIRTPRSLKEVYLVFTLADGRGETVRVSITGNELSYIYAGLKSVDNTSNVCGFGTAITTNQNDVTVGMGETFYVPEGTTVSITGELTVESGGTFNNCGTITVNEVNVSATSGVINNNGTFTITTDVDYKGTFSNYGLLTIAGDHEFKTNTGGLLNNSCTMIVHGSMLTTGSGVVNNFGYIKVTGDDGSMKTAGGGLLTLGSNSLTEVKYFDLQSSCNGPVSLPWAGIKTIDGKTTGGGQLTGYVDFCATGTIQPNNGTYGLNVTYCENNVPIPDCFQGIPPTITSSLTASGTTGQPIIPYIITASGTGPITYNATNLPAWLTYDPVTHTITGTAGAAGVYNITLTATNAYGTDSKILQLTITDGGSGSYISWYPNAVDFGTVVFEDLWPGFGDYDCNDLVVNFQYKIVSNVQNEITEIIATFIFKAAGADLNNGFGIVLNTPSSGISSVTGATLLGSAVTLDPKGFEAGSGDQTVIIVVDAINSMFGRGLVNTLPGGLTNQPVTKVISIYFTTPQSTAGSLPFNPFIFTNQERGREIHMKDKLPTVKANPEYFGIWADRSVPAQGKYYRSETGLPWAFEVPVDFEYPYEKIDILQAYLHFAPWAQSEGVLYPDWYQDLPNYRDPSKIWQP
jgi:LruC domain-containing protein